MKHIVWSSVYRYTKFNMLFLVLVVVGCWARRYGCYRWSRNIECMYTSFIWLKSGDAFNYSFWNVTSHVCVCRRPKEWNEKRACSSGMSEYSCACRPKTKKCETPDKLRMLQRPLTKLFQRISIFSLCARSVHELDAHMFSFRSNITLHQLDTISSFFINKLCVYANENTNQRYIRQTRKPPRHTQNWATKFNLDESSGTQFYQNIISYLSCHRIYHADVSRSISLCGCDELVSVCIISLRLSSTFSLYVLFFHSLYELVCRPHIDSIIIISGNIVDGEQTVDDASVVRNRKW